MKTQTAGLATKNHYLETTKKTLSLDLTPTQINDVEMLLTEAFYPLHGFLNQDDYESVLSNMRLVTGELWPLPITLDISSEFAKELQVGTTIALRDEEGVMLALMTVESIWSPDKTIEAEKVFGTNSLDHSGVNDLLHNKEAVYLGGKLEHVELPTHYDHRQYRHTPQELKQLFKKRGWQRIVAYHTHEPMHRLEQKITYQKACQLEANLLIQPIINTGQPNPFDDALRVRCYSHILSEYPEQTTFLSLISLNLRMAGPREALLHAIVRKNYGCTHFIINDDHASPQSTMQEQPFYNAQAAFLLARQHEEELGIKIVSLAQHVYVQERAEYSPVDSSQPHESHYSLSQNEFLRRLQNDLFIPEWFTFPNILSEIKSAYPPRHQQGFTVFFTGLSGSGKSTIANALRIKLLEKGGRPVTLLDGDVVRKNLSSELSFSKEHRDLNILRIGFVAKEITKNGGIAICAPIAPYNAIRFEVAKSIEPIGGYVEVYVSTPLEECEKRDRKGLYAKARAGLIKHFTGINDPYEKPKNPSLDLDTTHLSPDACAHKILLKLEMLGFLKN